MAVSFVRKFRAGGGISRKGGNKAGKPEEDAQREIVKFLRRMKDHGLLLFFAVPTQLLRNKVLRVIYWALGVEPGIPDLVILLRGGKTVFIELKAARGTLSPDQKICHANLRAFGFEVATIHCPTPLDGLRRATEYLQAQGLQVQL